MPTKEELRISFENSMELEKACKKLDERLPGVVCDKRGNLLFVNDRAKQRGFKSHEQSLFDVIYSDFHDIVAITLLESVSKAIELEEYGEYIIGRLGLPYRERNISIISVVLDAPQDAVSTLSGKLGMLPGVSVKTIFSKQSFTTGNNTDGE